MINKVSKNNERQRRHARLRAKLSGTATCPRLNVFRSNKHISCQIINDEEGKTLVACSSKNLGLKNGGNIEAAKTVGTKIAELALANNINEVVFDRGGYNYHGRIAALAQAAREAGLKF